MAKSIVKKIDGTIYLVLSTPSDLEIPGINLKPYPMEKVTSMFDLSFAANVSRQNIAMSLTYSTALYKEKTAQRMMECYTEVLEQVLENQDIKIKDISISHQLLSTNYVSLQEY